MITNYHTHCTYCDGKSTMEEMLQAAIDCGIEVLGFSSHAPLPFHTSWNMDADKIPAYLENIHKLQQSSKIEVLSGLEIDFIDGLCNAKEKRFTDMNLDYCIGSVHYVTPLGFPLPSSEILNDAGEPLYGFTVDCPEEEFVSSFARLYDNNGTKLVEDYYKALVSNIRCGGFDILGHFDLIRKNNINNRIIDENSSYYKELAMTAVDELKGTDYIVEINTGGMARGKTTSPYPELWILKELKARNIDICINSDAHMTKHINSYFELAEKIAWEAGYRHLTVLRKENRFRVAL